MNHTQSLLCHIGYQITQTFRLLRELVITGIASLLAAHGDGFLIRTKLFLVLRFTPISAALGIAGASSALLSLAREVLIIFPVSVDQWAHCEIERMGFVRSGAAYDSYVDYGGFTPVAFHFLAMGISDCNRGRRKHCRCCVVDREAAACMQFQNYALQFSGKTSMGKSDAVAEVWLTNALMTVSGVIFFSIAIRNYSLHVDGVSYQR